MARDYKGRSRQRKKTTPGWAWLLTGLAMGLCVALFVHLHHLGRQSPSEPVAARSATPASQQSDDEALPAAEPEAGFDFYTMLPGIEVVVPRDTPADGGAASTEAGPQLAPGRYWIQAGSFRNYQDADRRKAELALLGLASSIQEVNLDGQAWHRVRVGPLPDAGEAEQTRRRLAEAGIGALAVRERN